MTGPIPEEGVLLPETYLFTHGTTRTEIIARMKTAQKTLLDKLWAARTPRSSVPGHLQQAVVLASIVEKRNRDPRRAPPHRRGVRQPAENWDAAAI